MNTRALSLIGSLAVALILPASLTNCATAGGKPTFSQELPAESRIASGDSVKTSVTANAGVVITSLEQQRLSDHVTTQVQGLAGSGSRGQRSYRLAVQVTKYDKGNAIARAMLAGLGQMHLDGQITVYELPSQKPLSTFTISKTFAWGGIYGATTTMETVEEEFAKAVAKAIVVPAKS